MKLALAGTVVAVGLMTAHGGAARGAAIPRRPSLPLAGAITNPDWERRPSGEDMARAYPQIAQVMELSGDAVIECAVAVTGDVENCKVSSEKPLGIGFGQAAIELSSLFKMKPRTVDGVAVGGATVRIPISFRVSPDDEPPEPAATTPPPSPATLALARRVVVGAGVDRLINQSMDVTIKRMRAAEYAASSGAAAAGQEPAIEAVIGAFTTEKQVMIDELARMYAAEFDEKELALLAAHFESPAQKLWLAKQSVIEPLAARIAPRILADIARTARRNFCQKADCLAEAASKAQGPKP